MSLWELEVEKTKVNPRSYQRHGGLINKIFGSTGSQVGQSVKRDPKYSVRNRPRVAYASVKRELVQEYAELQQQSQPRSQGIYQNHRQVPQRIPHMDLEEHVFQDSSTAESQDRMKKAQPASRPPETQAQWSQYTQHHESRNAQDETYITDENNDTSTSDSLDQIAQLIIQKSRLEQEMRTREMQYDQLLKDAQDLNKQVCQERDALLQALETVRSPRPTTPPLSYEQPKDYHASTRPFSTEELTHLFRPHDETYYTHAFAKLESTIKHFVFKSLKSQPDRLRPKPLSFELDQYLSRHDLKVETVFGIRDIRCIVLRGFMMEFLLERIFRCFLFGLSPLNDDKFSDAFRVLSATDVGHGSIWAATIARMLIATSDDYRPHQAVESMVGASKQHLAPLIDFSLAPDLTSIVETAMEVARDCRIDYSSFSLEMPSHLVPYDPFGMSAGADEQGRVAVCCSPIVNKRGDLLGRNYQYSVVISKGKVWLESVFNELKDLAYYDFDGDT